MASGADGRSSSNSTGTAGQPVYRFTPKHTASVKLHLMSGVCVGPWCSLLWRSWRCIDWHLYWHRVLFLTFMSVINTLLALPDWVRYRHRISAQALHPEPVFILGNPRTGFPSSFISLEQAGAQPLLQPLLSPTRPMDNMRLTWDLPAEDEIAVTSLTGGTSFYTPLVLPRMEVSMRPMLTWERARVEDFRAWQAALVWFLKKVTLRDRLHGGKKTGGTAAPATPRPLLIKSPVHTGRLRVWRQMFPQAKYVYIHRHPVDVFRSSAHMVDTYFWYCYLQRPTDAQLTDYILDQYTAMYDAYMQERVHVPEGKLVEVSFAELEIDPLGTLKNIYDTFGWSERYESLLPQFRRYCETLTDFKKNQFNTLPADLEARVRKQWADSFKHWGYQ